MAVVLVLGGRSLVTIFNPDRNVVEIVTQYFWLVPISYGAVGLLQMTSSAFNAMGKPIPSISIKAIHMAC